MPVYKIKTYLYEKLVNDIETISYTYIIITTIVYNTYDCTSALILHYGLYYISQVTDDFFCNCNCMRVIKIGEYLTLMNKHE